MNRRGFLKALMGTAIAVHVPWTAIADYIEPVAPKLSEDIKLSFNEIVAETMRKYKHIIVDTVTKNNAFLNTIKRGATIQ